MHPEKTTPTTTISLGTSFLAQPKKAASLPPNEGTGLSEGEGGDDKRMREFEMAKRSDEERARRNEEKKRFSLKLGTWIVSCFAMRALDVEFFIVHEELDVLFVRDSPETVKIWDHPTAQV